MNDKDSPNTQQQQKRQLAKYSQLCDSFALAHSYFDPFPNVIKFVLVFVAAVCRCVCVSFLRIERQLVPINWIGIPIKYNESHELWLLLASFGPVLLVVLYWHGPCRAYGSELHILKIQCNGYVAQIKSNKTALCQHSVFGWFLVHVWPFVLATKALATISRRVEIRAPSRNAAQCSTTNACLLCTARRGNIPWHLIPFIGFERWFGAVQMWWMCNALARWWLAFAIFPRVVCVWFDCFFWSHFVFSRSNGMPVWQYVCLCVCVYI